jgi:hypothetical protein
MQREIVMDGQDVACRMLGASLQVGEAQGGLIGTLQTAS